MTIIKKDPENNGAHANQTWGGDAAPEGYATIPENLMSAWDAYKPFVTLEIVGDDITAIVDNPDARAAQETADAEKEIPLDELTLTQLAIAELAEAQEATQTANELALAELAEIITGGE